ncbi:MAG: serine/threonine-protein phosphatase [Gemmatimonadetes bacterium]|nr:serine/threonine-protein phosphatase [Gemmatimonadota bacterium]
MTTPDPTPAVDSPNRMPRDDEVDVFGLTHLGKVRKTNQDNFLISSLHKQMRVHYTSLPEVARLPLEGERLAYLCMVADGVGGGLGGGEASRHAIEVVAQYVAESMCCYYTADATDEQAFCDSLQEAAMHCHQSVAEKAGADPDRRGMATTLTMLISVWPVTYLLQVGDSRCYLLREGTLTQITRDQTMAQELVDQGVLTVANADNTRWAHVLSSAIGGRQTAPVVTRIDRMWDDVILLCSDGLTKHVSDDRIRERLSTMRSSKQVCEDLLQDALDGGGSDNITVLVGRLVRKPSE